MSGQRARGRLPLQRQPDVPAREYEAHVALGLEQLARDELQRRLGAALSIAQPARAGLLRFRYAGALQPLLSLKTILEVSLVLRFAVPRPKALLGDQHFRELTAAVSLVRAALPAGAYTTLHLNAAGADSAVLLRLRDQLAAAAGLLAQAEEGDMLLRLRRPADGTPGWEVLLRISPRPLATRPWRVCNMQGALNATVAHAMSLLSQPRPGDSVLNLACGSATLLIERLSAAPARRALGCDLSAEALACARANLQASQSPQVELYDWDARALPLPDASISALLADLPFGHLVGSHQQNLELYPAILKEAARVAAPGARLVLISHELRLMERLVEQSSQWRPASVLRVSLGGLNPRIFVLERI